MHQKYRILGLCLAFSGSLALGSCSKGYDDSALQGRITKVEGRVTQIENQLKTMNTNISSLQAMVEALKSNTPISAVTPVANNGYQLTFSGGKSITIYPDSSGRVDSSRPTPRFKIENDYWFVSYDNARSWERLSRAKGDQGERGVPGLQGERGIAGERGANGHTPVIGMERGSDGQYYWTVDGRRLQTSGGTAVTAVTTPRFKIENNRWYISYDNGSSWVDLGQAKGDTGITPSFRIQNDYWEVSYNNGQSWIQLGRAKGDKGDRGEAGAAGTNASDGANSFGAVFRTVIEDSSAVHVTLASGDRLSIPKVGGISINFSQSNNLVVVPDYIYRIGYTLSGASIGEKASVEAIAQDGYKVTVTKETDKTGQIVISTPRVIVSSRIILLVSDGVSQTITSALVLGGSSTNSSLGVEVDGRILRIATSATTLTKEGGNARIELYTNTNYRVSIPYEARHWLSINPGGGRALVRSDIVYLRVLGNSKGDARSAAVSIVDDSGAIQETIVVYQGGREVQSYHVAIAGTLERLINVADRETLTELKLTGQLDFKDYEFLKRMPMLRKLDISSINNTTLPASAFEGSNLVEVKLPMGLKSIPSRLFYNSKLQDIQIPSRVESIGSLAFASIQNRISIVNMPKSLKRIGAQAFWGTSLGALYLNDGLIEIGREAFANTRITGGIYIPETVVSIPEGAFRGARLYRSGGLPNVKIGNGVRTIERYAFMDLQCEGNLIMGDGLLTIGDSAFENAIINISNIGANVETIGFGAFSGATFLTNLIIPDKVKELKRGTFKKAKVPTGFIVIGSSVQSIGEDAFKDVSFKKVWCKAAVPPTIDAFSFSSAYLDSYVGVPIGSKGQYRSKSHWSRFRTIEEIEF